MWDYASWLNVQNGGAPVPFQIIDAANARYINDNRALSAYLRADFSPQAFIMAALMLQGFGLNALAPSNPYRTSLNQAGMATFGGGELIDLVSRAAGNALKACWYQKWAVHRRNVTATRDDGMIHDFVLLNALRGTSVVQSALAQASNAIRDALSRCSGGIGRLRRLERGCPCLGH